MGRVIYFLCLVLASVNSNADVYKCSTENGVTYSQTPCSSNSSVLRTKSPIIGTWLWHLDKIQFNSDGKGRYFRNSDICYEFSYQYLGRDLIIKADRHHNCGGETEAKYFAEMGKNTLVMKHSGSGFVTTWRNDDAMTTR